MTGLRQHIRSTPVIGRSTAGEIALGGPRDARTGDTGGFDNQTLVVPAVA
jgi:hypothetical protein